MEPMSRPMSRGLTRGLGLGMAVALGFLVGCASQEGQRRPVAIEPAEAGGSTGMSGGEGPPPERLDEIQDLLRRKANDVAHCWSDEASRTHNRELKADIMLKLTIGTAGRAEVEVVSDSTRSAEFEHCVVGMVSNIDFPPLPAPQVMTWPYSFKPLY